MASRISGSVGCGDTVEQRLGRHEQPGRAEAALDRAEVDEGLLQRVQALRRAARPSTVVTARPSTSPTSVRQALTGSPSTSTMQAPHSPSPQPSLVPGEPEALAQTEEQRLGGFGVEDATVAVHEQVHVPHRFTPLVARERESPRVGRHVPRKHPDHRPPVVRRGANVGDRARRRLGQVCEFAPAARRRASSPLRASFVPSTTTGVGATAPRASTRRAQTPCSTSTAAAALDQRDVHGRAPTDLAEGRGRPRPGTGRDRDAEQEFAVTEHGPSGTREEVRAAAAPGGLPVAAGRPAHRRRAGERPRRQRAPRCRDCRPRVAAARMEAEPTSRTPAPARRSGHACPGSRPAGAWVTSAPTKRRPSGRGRRACSSSTSRSDTSELRAFPARVARHQEVGPSGQVDGARPAAGRQRLRRYPAVGRSRRSPHAPR